MVHPRLVAAERAVPNGGIVTDTEFRLAFESTTLTPDQWTHEAHVRIAWLYLVDGSFDSALNNVREGIRRLNLQFSKADRYHETVTMAFLCLIHDRINDKGEGGSFANFAAYHPDLITTSPLAVARYYRRETLDSEKARTSFVEPDRHAFPGISELKRSLGIV